MSTNKLDQELQYQLQSEQINEVLHYQEGVYQENESSGEENVEENSNQSSSDQSNNDNDDNNSQGDNNNQSHLNNQMRSSQSNLNQFSPPDKENNNRPAQFEEIDEKNKLTFCMQENCKSYKKGLLPKEYKEHHQAHVNNLDTPLFIQIEETTFRELVRKSLSRNISSEEAIEQFSLTNTLNQCRKICNFLDEYKNLLTKNRQIVEPENKTPKNCEKELLLPNKPESQEAPQLQQLLIQSQGQLQEQDNASNALLNGNTQQYEKIEEEEEQKDDKRENKQSIKEQQQQQSQLEIEKQNDHSVIDEKALNTQQQITEHDEGNQQANIFANNNNNNNVQQGIHNLQNIQTSQQNQRINGLDDNNNNKSSSDSLKKEETDPSKEFIQKYFASSGKCEFDDITADFISVFSFIKRAKKAYNNNKKSTDSRTSSQILANCYSEIWESQNGIKNNRDSSAEKKRQFKKLSYQKIQEILVVIMYCTLCAFEFVQICMWSDDEDNYPSNSALRVLVLILFFASGALTLVIYVGRVCIVQEIPLLFQILHCLLSLLVFAYFLSTLIVEQNYYKWCYLSFMIVFSAIASGMVILELVLNKKNWNQAKRNLEKLQRITDRYVIQEDLDKLI